MALARVEDLLPRVSSSGSSGDARIELLELAGSLSRKMKKFSAAERHHRDAHALKGIRGATAFSMLRSYVNLATDLKRLGKHLPHLRLI